MARPLVEVSGQDAGDRPRSQGYAQGVQQSTDAEPESLGRGGSPVPPLLPLVRRAVGSSGDLGRRRALTDALPSAEPRTAAPRGIGGVVGVLLRQRWGSSV